jgi:hypothetical protein
MLAMPFRFRKNEYFSLVRVKQRIEGVKLEVTIMNGELERVFYGYHKFMLDSGCVKSDNEPSNEEVRELQHEIRSALDLFVNRHLLLVA